MQIRCIALPVRILKQLICFFDSTGMYSKNNYFHFLIKVPPCAPVNLRLLKATQRTLVVTWQPPLDKGIPASNYYLIYIQALPKEMNFTVSYSSTNGLQTVAYLQPGILYKVSVCAYNLAGQGPITEATFSTNPDKGMLWEI